MPFEIVRNDIINMRVDAIVNTANPKPVIGSGTDAGIHAKAGPELLEARKKIGNIQVGCINFQLSALLFPFQEANPPKDMLTFSVFMPGIYLHKFIRSNG